MSGTFWFRYRTPSGSGKSIEFGLRIETGTERTTIVDIFDIIQQVRDTGIHLKVDKEQINLNTSRPSEHLPVRGEKMSKRLGGITGCKHKTS